MVKGISTKINLDEFMQAVKNLPKEEILNSAEKAGNVIERDVKTVSEIPAENIRAKYASQIDAPILSRFKYEPKKLPLFHVPPRDKQIELLADTIKSNAPKTKEEALAKLENIVQEAKKANAEIPEDVIQGLKNDIIKKFGV